jgi:hypothetical protein
MSILMRGDELGIYAYKRVLSQAGEITFRTGKIRPGDVFEYRGKPVDMPRWATPLDKDGEEIPVVRTKHGAGTIVTIGGVPPDKWAPPSGDKSAAKKAETRKPSKEDKAGVSGAQAAHSLGSSSPVGSPSRKA